MIDTPESLSEFLPSIRSSAWVAMDTEADSLHAYPEKVCLIQICVEGGDRLVDPLARGMRLDPLFEVLRDREIIMHGADYDLRLLWKHHRHAPGGVFDTMLAARLIGQDRFGLGDLLTRFLGITLQKSSQKADWARRPLTPRMEDYARNDVRHLKPLADLLSAELQKLGRLEWHRESCARLLSICAQDVPPDADGEWRVKGSHYLRPPALAVLREIWYWREREAIGGNRPPFFILSPEQMVAMAVSAVDGSGMEKLVPVRFSPRRREDLLTAVHRGLAVPPPGQPPVRRQQHHRPTESEMRRFRDLEMRRNRNAEKLKLDPALIASRPILGRLARNWDEASAELMEWQRHLLK